MFCKRIIKRLYNLHAAFFCDLLFNWSFFFLCPHNSTPKMKPSENEKGGAPKSGQSNCVVESGTKPTKVIDGGWGWVVMVVSFVHHAISG